MSVRVCGALFIVASNIAFAAPNLDSYGFTDEVFKLMDLNAYCGSTYGEEFSVTRDGDHAYDWQCTDGDVNYGISSGELCITQWGEDFRPVLLGNHSYDWACTDWSESNNQIVPVIIIASEFFRDIDTVNNAIEVFSDRMKITQDWYAEHMESGKTFTITKPVVRLSLTSSAIWHEYSCLTASSEGRPEVCTDKTTPFDRGLLFSKMIDEVSYLFDNKNEETNIVSPVFVYTKDGGLFGLGAAANFINDVEFNAQPPSIGACDFNDAECGIYAIGHEIGHNFDLGHSCNLEPVASNCYFSIMENPSNFFSKAILLDQEQEVLDSSSFFD